SIKGEGDYVFGVNSFSGNYVDGEILSGNTKIEVGTIEISGDHAAGVVATSYGSLEVKVDDLKIDGNESGGVFASAIGNVSVEVGDAVFTGDNNGAIVAFSYGEASVKLGTLTAENGGGVVAFGTEGAYASADKIAISGDFQNGIQSVSMFGDATLKVGEVSTNGFFAVAVNGDSGQGDVRIEAGKITTAGELAMGIRAFGRTTSIELTGPLSTSGDWAFGILNASMHGDATVRASGPISTTGEGAVGAWITGRYGTADIVVDSVSTSGDDARGIWATGEDGQVKLVAEEVSTSGANADGIHARTRYVEVFLGQPPVPDPVEFTGDIDIEAGTVSVTGAGSIGISARGLGRVDIDVGSVSAVHSYGVDVNMIGEASLRIGEQAISKRATAVRMEAADIDIAVDEGALVRGAEHGIVIRAEGERCVAPNPKDGSLSPCPNPGDDEFHDPVPVPGPGGAATIVNAGTIRGGTGYAVKVEKGALTLRNSGRIVGAMLLADGDDLIENEGTFDVRADSDFGAGDDRFVNSGVVKLGTTSAPATYRFLGLERFDNQGLVDLRNTAVGDVFSLSGDYAGSGDATLALDVDLANNKADTFVVEGAATGETQIVLDLTPGTARLTSESGITLVETGEDSNSDAFVLAESSQDIGFIRYGLNYDAAARRYALTGVASAGAYRQLNALEGAENLWHVSADAWRANAAAERDARFAGADGPRRGTLWAQALGGRISRDEDTDEAGIAGGETVDFAYEQSRIGGQLGVDFAGYDRNDSGLRIGLTAGYIDSELESRAAAEKLDMETFNVGAYASFTSGRLFAGALLKHDWHDIGFDSDADGFEGDADGRTWGVEGEIGARFGGGGFFVEPVASLAWTSTSLDDLQALGQSLDFRGADGLRGKLGARIGGRSDVGNGDALVFHAAAKAVHDFGGDYRLDLNSSGAAQELSSKRIGTFGEGLIGASYIWRGGFEAFVEGQSELGSEYDGLGGRIGFRLRL
ncbi:MAG TPA: autotransporter outer membrane beta-barrel domain-containing protein, partial [Allosphingosinicella sp.]